MQEAVALLKRIYSRRTPWSHKGSMGKLLIVAGSERYTGSPIFNAMSALKAGCDLVTLVTPRRVADIAVAAWPDIITVPFNGSYLNLTHIQNVLKLCSSHDALLIGGGLGQEKETFLAIGNIIHSCPVPLVIDADGLRALSGHLDILEGKKAILTPHADEFRDIGGGTVSDTVEDRRFKAFQFTQLHHVTVVLKGHVDIVSDGVEVYENETGSDYMTKGGFGDTMAGICGAILARGVMPFETGCAAAFLNGKTGELIAHDKKEGALASDVFDYLPQVIEKITNPKALYPKKINT